MKATIKLPSLSDQQWRLALDAFGCKVDIPAGPKNPLLQEDPTYARTKLTGAIIADNALDELPLDRPDVVEELEPFLNLSEAEAMTVLFVNNLHWETGEVLWHEAHGAVA